MVIESKGNSTRRRKIARSFFFFISPKDGDHILDGDDKQLIVGFKVDRDGIFGVK